MKPAHCRVVFEGVTGSVTGPLEHWSFGINFPHDVLPADGTQLVDDGVAAALKEVYSTNIAPIMMTDRILTLVKVSRVGADGHVEKRADGSYIQGEWQGTSYGAGTTVGLPLQTALVVSLETARAGATGRGRFFLPFPAKAIDQWNKRLSPEDAADVAARAKAFLNGLAQVTTYGPVVASSKGYLTPVTGVRVGRVPDTMRSRREDLPEGYVHLPLA